MKALQKLPKGYKENIFFDLQKDKKLFFLVNGLSLGIVLLMVVPMLFIVPITKTFDFSGSLWMVLLKLGTMSVSAIAYLFLHELVHGVAMKICGTKKVSYGFKGVYAYAGSADYYSKGSYIFIALAPVVLWGLVLLALSIFLPQSWFWVVYLIQLVNLSGAAGDFVVTVRFMSLPQDVLIRDEGVAMHVYSLAEKAKKTDK